jgi:dipeptidyl aminopeptidase/acylaminoacyl peptidase
MRLPIFMTVLLPALLALAGAALAAGPPCPLVFNDNDAVMLLAPGETKARKIGTGRSPTLSPDGKLAVWIEGGEEAATARLMLRDLADGTTSLLAKPGGLLRTPRFSPDGQAVAFVRLDAAAVSELWLVRPGEGPVRLARAGGQAGDDFFEPVWNAADGSLGYHDMRFLYRRASDDGQVRKTPLAALAPGQEAMFTSADRFVANPKTGSILFSLPVPGTPLFRKKVPDLSSALFVHDAATQRSTRITPQNMTAFTPAWTPDGEAVIFTGYTDAQAGERSPMRIWLLRPDGQPELLGRGEDALPPSGR